MDYDNEIITKDAQATAKVGENLARVGDGRIFCLYGDLGSGKTTFTQGFAKGLGWYTRLLSPTFIIVRRYTISENILFYHIDLYRLHTDADVGLLGLTEIFSDPRAYVVIEWAEKLGGLLPGRRVDVRFETLAGGEHKIWITKH